MSDEQRCQTGCIAGRMPTNFWDATLDADLDRASTAAGPVPARVASLTSRSALASGIAPAVRRRTLQRSGARALLPFWPRQGDAAVSAGVEDGGGRLPRRLCLARACVWRLGLQASPGSRAARRRESRAAGC